MTKRYQIIKSDNNMKIGIWDYCGWKIETNGKIFRITYNYVHWKNNNGSLRTKNVYLTRAAGRKVLKAIRCAEATHQLGNCGGLTPYEIATEQLTSNWYNSAPSIGIN